MTKNLKADKLLIADSLVRFQDRSRTVGPLAVTVRLVATPVVFATLVTNVEATVTVAAGSLKGVGLMVEVPDAIHCMHGIGIGIDICIVTGIGIGILIGVECCCTMHMALGALLKPLLLV